MSALTTFLSTAVGIQNTGQSQLLQAFNETTVVLTGSFVVFTCANGYVNNGGNLNLTCNADGSWSTPLPNCVLSSGGSQTTLPPTNGQFCPYSSTMLNITNGYASSWTNLILATANLATSGSYIDYMCSSPFTMVGNSRVTCVNGAFTAQPVCTGK